MFDFYFYLKMNPYAYIDDCCFHYLILKSLSILPIELIHLINIFYISSFPISLLACGDYHTFYYKEDMLYGFGWNEYGQLYLDSSVQKTKMSAKYLPHLIDINCGSLFSVLSFQKSKINIYGIGNNYSGQIGRYVHINTILPEKIKIDYPILKVRCGSFHTVIITTKHVYGLGSNQYGQLSHMSEQVMNYYVPTIMNTEEIEGDIIDGCCGSCFTFLMTKDYVYGLGANKYGQLGLEDQIDHHKPTLIDVKNVVQMSAGTTHTMFLCKGDLYGVGGNKYGQLGLGHQEHCYKKQKVLSDVLSVSCGDFFTLVLCKDALYSFGANQYGQLGLDSLQDASFPQKINLKEKILSLSCGKNFAMVNTRNGLYGFGANGKNQLGESKKIDYIDRFIHPKKD